MGDRTSGLNCLTLAGRLEDQRLLRAMTEEVYSHVEQGERVAFPAVLGIRNSRDIHKRWNRHAASPYSRRRRCRRRFRDTGCISHSRIPSGQWESTCSSGTTSTTRRHSEGESARSVSRWVRARNGFRDAPLSWQREGLVGKGITGSYDSAQGVRFSNLPVAAPKKRTDWFRKRLFDPAGHPIKQGGDRRRRPSAPGRQKRRAGL